MKKVTLAVALTGSCALFYLLYNMKQKSKDKRSSKKNKIKCSHFEMNKSECRCEENSTKSILYSKGESRMHNGKLTDATESNSELAVSNSPCESSKSMKQNDPNSKETIDIGNENPKDIQLGINEMCSVNLSTLNVHSSSIRANDLQSEGYEARSNINFSLPSEAGFCDFFVDNINEEISSESNSSAMPDIVDNSSSKYPNIFKTENEVNGLSISNANTCHIPVSTVPEKTFEDASQISSQQECLSNLNSNMILSNLNGSTSKFDAVQDHLEKLQDDILSLSIDKDSASVPPVLHEEDCTLIVPRPQDDASILILPEVDCTLVAPKGDDCTTLVQVSQDCDDCTLVAPVPKVKGDSGLASEKDCDSSILGAKEYCEAVVLVAKTDSLVSKKEYTSDTCISKNFTVTKLGMDCGTELSPKSKKKQKQRAKKRATKDPASDHCKEDTPELADAVKKVSDFNSSKYLCEPNIKKGFWSASEVEGNLKNESGLIENKVAASSPDHLCTSDLERETSQTPEHENITSDSQSLASFDSGQGSIEQETIFSNMLIPEANSDYYITYQFEIPQTLVGKLIGKKGAFLSKIKAATSTNVIVVTHNDNNYKLCSIEGKKWQVLQALDLIRDHFPAQKFPELCLNQVNISSPEHQPQMNRQLLQVELPPGVVLEVQTSSIISTGEVWLQQPLHPTFSALQRLHQCLNLNYGDGSSAPTVPLTTPAGTVCVCQIGDQWLRCQVEEHDDTTATVCLLDVGGYVSLPLTLLRQIRMDYVSLPFQASRCYLYGIEPNTDDGWDEKGRSALLQLCNNTIIFATIAAYSEDGIPLVNLYQRHFNQYTFINEQIVKMNHAKWISTPAFTEST